MRQPVTSGDDRQDPNQDGDEEASLDALLPSAAESRALHSRLLGDLDQERADVEASAEMDALYFKKLIGAGMAKGAAADIVAHRARVRWAKKYPAEDEPYCDDD